MFTGMPVNDRDLRRPCLRTFPFLFHEPHALRFTIAVRSVMLVFDDATTFQSCRSLDSSGLILVTLWDTVDVQFLSHICGRIREYSVVLFINFNLVSSESYQSTKHFVPVSWFRNFGWRFVPVK